MPYWNTSEARPWVKRSSAAFWRRTGAAAAHGRVGIGPAPGADRGARGDVHDRAAARDHVGEHGWLRTNGAWKFTATSLSHLPTG